MAGQEQYVVASLPAGSLAASAAFMSDHLAGAKAILAKPEVTALAVVLPNASPDHTDWRRSLALDLAREYTPQCVNVVEADDKESTQKVLAYLRDAPGVTGQYLQSHG